MGKFRCRELPNLLKVYDVLVDSQEGNQEAQPSPLTLPLVSATTTVQHRIAVR